MADERNAPGEEETARQVPIEADRDKAKRSAGDGLVVESNIIEPGPERQVARDDPRAQEAATGSPPDGPPHPAKKRSNEIGDVPEEIAARYYSENRTGRRDFFSDPQSKDAAFRDGGGKLSADRADPAVISDMLKVTQHRGWDQLTVSGSPEFRREVWIQAQELGVEVRGYKPNERDLQEVDRRAAERQNAHGGEIDSSRNVKGASRDREDGDGPDRPNGGNRASAARPDPDAGISGKLLEVGEAPYKGKSGGDASPFVKIELENGKLHTVWGVGLPQALKAAGAEIGDDIIVQRKAQEPVMKKVLQRDPETGKPIKDHETGKARYEEKAVTRNVWAVTAEKFRTGDREERTSNPALRGPESQMRAIETYVKERVSDPAAQERLVNGAREKIAAQLEHGAAFGPARVADRERHKDITDGRSAARQSPIQDRAANSNPAKAPEPSIAAKAQQEMLRRRDQERERER